VTFQVHEILKGMHDLDPSYKENDFEIVLQQMFEEHKYRLQEGSEIVTFQLMTWDYIQRYVTYNEVINLPSYLQNAKTRKYNLLEYYTFMKLQFFNAKEFNNVKTK
jgi:hypothetical protein